MTDYKSREYCKAVACEVQLELEKHEKGSRQYEAIKNTCKTSCKKTAWEFHDWLQKQNYRILR